MNLVKLKELLEAEREFAFIVSTFYKMLRKEKINPISSAIIASEFMRFLLDNAEVLKKGANTNAILVAAKRSSDIPAAS